MLIKVSFSLPSHPLLAGANMIVGGFEQTPLKYEKGARLLIPLFEVVETKAIGLGTIEPIISLCVSEKGCSAGS